MKHSFHPVALLILLPTAFALAADAPKPPLEVKFTAPARGEVVRYVKLPGNIRPNQQVTLYAKVAGYLHSIKVDRGDAVKAGDKLAQIQAPELQDELARYKAEMAKAKADVTKARAEVDIAGLDSQRLVKAVKQAPDLVVEQTVDAAKARLESARAAVEIADAAVDIAKANIDRTETMIAYTTLTAPFAGIVTARHIDPGAFVAAATSGSAAQTAAVVTIMDFNTVRVQVPVTEIEAPLVTVGQPVKVNIDSLPGRTFDGKVTRHGYALDDVSKTMLVEAEMPNPKLELRPGMYALVRVGVEKHTDVLNVPVDALVMEKANAFVFTLVEGKAKKVAVKPGFNDGAKVEITSGLTGNEKVILTGKLALADGQAVAAVEAK
jgi:membrane fusion protein (multidrug efflux system)